MPTQRNGTHKFFEGTCATILSKGNYLENTVLLALANRFFDFGMNQICVITEDRTEIDVWVKEGGRLAHGHYGVIGQVIPGVKMRALVKRLDSDLVKLLVISQSSPHAESILENETLAVLMVNAKSMEEVACSLIYRDTDSIEMLNEEIAELFDGNVERSFDNQLDFYFKMKPKLNTSSRYDTTQQQPLADHFG